MLILSVLCITQSSLSALPNVTGTCSLYLVVTGGVCSMNTAELLWCLHSGKGGRGLVGIWGKYVRDVIGV